MDECAQSPNTNEAIYQIKIRGELDERWSDWLNCLGVIADGDFTLLTGVVDDQAKLRGILSRIWDLNLEVISVARVEQIKNSLDEDEEVNNG